MAETQTQTQTQTQSQSQLSMGSRLVPLLLRMVTLVLLLIALIILTTNTATLQIDLLNYLTIHFNDIYTYRYMLCTMVFGAVYSLLQIVFGVIQVCQGSNLIKSDLSLTLNFYGDKIISYVLATGSAAGFGATKDLEPLFSGSSANQFFQKGYASASMLLLAFVCTAVISVISSYSLPKRT